MLVIDRPGTTHVRFTLWSKRVCDYTATPLLVTLIVVGSVGCRGAGEGYPTERGYDEIGDRATAVDGVVLKSFGIPNRHLKNTTVALLDPERGVDATVLQGTHSHGVGRVVRFQPSSGATTYLSMRGALGSWAISAPGDGSAYVGSHQTGYLFYLAPGADTLQRVEVPRPKPMSYDWVFSVAEASDGWIYFGTYPEGALLRYQPISNRVEELGQLIPATNRAQYLRHTNARFAGKLYAGMGAIPELLEYDLSSGTTTPMLPSGFEDRSFVYYTSRFRDLLLAVVSPNDRLLFFDPETRRIVRNVGPPGDSPGFMRYASDSFVEYGGELVFGTADDDRLWRYNFDANQMTLLAESVGAPIGLAAEHFLFCLNSQSTYSILDLRSMEVVRTAPTMFQGDGMQIHAISEGPDGDVMGGIYINQGFFRQYLDPPELESPGTSVTFGGQIDQLLAAHDRIYLGHYTSARLSVYDPAEAWNPGTGPRANPRVLGSVENEQDRFPAMTEGPDGRIYLGSIPKYGKLGGALVVLDPATNTWKVRRNIVPDQSVLSLVTHPDGYVVGGTGITGGLGSAPTADQGHLFFFDPARGGIVRDRVVVDGAAEVWGLDLLADGRIVGTADSTAFVYDPATDEVIRERVVAPEVIKKIVASADGWVYAMNEHRLFRFSPDLEELQTLDEYEGYWDSMVELPGGRLFVARGAELMEVIR